MISADDVLATLAFLIPGFVALKVVYWFGQRSKRADWEWTLWSVLVSAPIAFAADRIASAVGSKSGTLASAIANCGVTNASGKSGEDLRAALASCASDSIAANNADLRLAIALAIAVAAGFAGVFIWRFLTSRNPNIQRRASLQAWDAVLREPQWIQVKVGDTVYYGYSDVIADPTETDELDIYLKRPSRIVGGRQVPMNNTAGVLLARDKIDWIQVLKPSYG
jgi:hypothetical protein